MGKKTVIKKGDISNFNGQAAVGIKISKHRPYSHAYEICNVYWINGMEHEYKNIDDYIR